MTIVVDSSVLDYSMTADSFANELQKDWELVAMTVSPKETVVAVRTSYNHGVADPVGRDGLSILSHPAIYSELEQAEFRFQKCLFVRAWDEVAISILDADTAHFEGRTFRRYSKSALLDLHSRLSQLTKPGVHFHYRLTFPNEIVDIVCQTAPLVTLRQAVVQDTLAAKAP